MRYGFHRHALNYTSGRPRRPGADGSTSTTAVRRRTVCAAVRADRRTRFGWSRKPTSPAVVTGGRGGWRPGSHRPPLHYMLHL